MTTEQIVLVAEKVMASYGYDNWCGHVRVSVGCMATQRVCWFVDSPQECRRGRYYRDLMVTCQMDKRGGEPYGFGIGYRNAGAIDSHVARQMHLTLKRIHKQLDRMSESAGPAATFGCYVTRFAEIIEANVLLVECEARRWVEVQGFGKAYLQKRHGITEEVNWLCGEVRVVLSPNKGPAA